MSFFNCVETRQSLHSKEALQDKEEDIFLFILKGDSLQLTEFHWYFSPSKDPVSEVWRPRDRYSLVLKVRISVDICLSIHHLCTDIYL